MKTMKKKPNRSKVKNPQFADHNISTLDQYKRAGGNLTPPLADIGPIAFSKWRDEGLNEVLWAAILRANMERSACLTLFRRVVTKAHDLDPIYNLIIRYPHPAIMTRYGRGFACSPAHISRSVMVSSW